MDKFEEIGKRLGDPDVAAYGMGVTGVALISSGKVEEGLRLLDEATVAAVGGELQPRTAGGICCASIEACASLGDWRRAAEWTEAQDRWCQREGIAGYPGMCRLVAQHAATGRATVLVTAAPADLAEPVAASLGMTAALGTVADSSSRLRNSSVRLASTLSGVVLLEVCPI